MNDKTRRRLESGQRCKQWTIDYATLIPAGSIFLTRCNELVVLVDNIENLTGELSASKGEGMSATDVKSASREDLIEIMEKLRRAAKAAEPDHPGTQDRYRFRRAMSHEDLLATARGFERGGSTDEALLVSYGAPAGWATALKEAADEFEATFGQQSSAKGSQVAANAEIVEKVDQMMQLKRTIGYIIENVLTGNTGAIAAWHSAAHVEKPPAPPPPSPAAPATS